MGLAWSYYYGFISLVLPHLAGEIDAYKAENIVKKCYKLLIVIPMNCEMPEKVQDIDDRFSHHGCTKHKQSRAGKEREYAVQLYRIEVHLSYLFSHK